MEKGSRFLNFVTNHSVKCYAIPSINAYLTEKHVAEDIMLFTIPLVGEMLTIFGIITKTEHSCILRHSNKV